MFPIQSMSGRILGFGGRILTNDKSKQNTLISPESEIYHKSKVLYGIFKPNKLLLNKTIVFWLADIPMSFSSINRE